MVNVSRLTYPERLATFEGFWDGNQATALQLASIGHVYDRPPLESLDEGSRCISCNVFVKRHLSTRAFEGGPAQGSYEDGFDSFNFHHPSCTRLQVRIPLDPQALFGGLHGYRLESLRSKFERKTATERHTIAPQRASQSSGLFNLPTEIRLEIYSMILPTLDAVTPIDPLHRDSPRVITRRGAAKTGRRDTSKPNILRTCRAVSEEAMDLLYSNTTFQFGSTKVMYLFLRSIGNKGRRLIKSVDVHCGGREDAISFALLAACHKLQTICIRLPRPRLLFPRAPLWCIDGMSCLLSISGLQKVTFGACESALTYMDDDRPDAAIIRRELMRPKGSTGDATSIEDYLDVYRSPTLKRNEH